MPDYYAGYKRLLGVLAKGENQLKHGLSQARLNTNLYVFCTVCKIAYELKTCFD